MQFIYKIIYNPFINYILRNINFLFKNSTKLKIPPSGIIKIKLKTKKIKLATNQTSYLTQLIFWKGHKSFEYSELFETLSKRIDYFFDIGSNIGYYSIIGVASNPKMKVFAFEPALGPKFYLNKNIILNKFSNNIKTCDFALSNKKGVIDFYEVENLKYRYLKHNLAGEGNAGTKKTSRNFIIRQVKTTTLDEFTAKNSIKKIDLIKIDTEGTEIDILKKGIHSIKLFEPIIICETLYNKIESELETFFKSLDYKFYNHTKYGLNEVTTIKRAHDNGIRNCFFVPNSKINLIKEFLV